MAISKIGRGMLNAANDTYHGAKSLAENGAIAHASAYARVLLTEGRAATEDEALVMANHEVRRIRSAMKGEQLNRAVRMALRLKDDAPPATSLSFT